VATLDRVIQMQQEGRSDNEVIAQLQNEGVSPSEINDAINQAKVKNAVSPPEQVAQPAPAQSEGIQPPVMPTPSPAAPQAPLPPTQPQAAPQEEYYTPQPQAYGEQDYYPQTEGYGTETISEIAQQVAIESLEDYKSKVGDMASFKNQIQNQVNNIDDRLQRIENSIAQLQQSILGKIGEYGENYATVHKDLDNLHGTMSKLMNPLIDNVNEIKKLNK